MSKRYLGDTIDIHAGGEDLIFPHHSNEIAQSEAANGVKFSNYWMHNGFLNIDNKKMSKSLGNFFTVRDISKKYDLQVLRFFMLSAHYRSPINFSADLMEAAKNGLVRIITAVEKLDGIIPSLEEREMNESEKGLLTDLENLRIKFNSSMEDDFNTADAISAIFEMVKLANVNIDEKSSKEFAVKIKDTIVLLSDVLGIITEKEQEILDEDIEKMIEDRQNARKNKDFAKADEIRNSLLEMGIILEDTREGVKWKRA